MTNEKPATQAAPAEETVKVKLKAEHTHAGKDYAAGTELDVDKATAEWLTKAGVIDATVAASSAPAKS